MLSSNAILLNGAGVSLLHEMEVGSEMQSVFEAQECFVFHLYDIWYEEVLFLST